jgi:transcription elongation factor Elf1
MNQPLQEASPLVKTVDSVCPTCGGTVSLVVPTYKSVVRARSSRTFYCQNCDREFSVPVEAMKFSVASAAD